MSFTLQGRLAWPHGEICTLGIEGSTIASIVPGGDEAAGALWITPGFVDAHGHPPLLGDQLASVDLSGAPSYAQALRTIGAAKVPSGWILGGGWDQHRWPDAPPGGWPLADDLERVAGGRPALLHRVDRHAVWASRTALASAGITRDTPDPPAGHIVRDTNGHPTGVLVDRAAELLSAPPPDDTERERRLRAALVSLASHGLTGVHEMAADDATWRIYRRMDDAGELPVRVWVWVLEGTEVAESLMRDGPYRGKRLAGRGIKAFADGALGSHGALLAEPYLDDPSTRGLCLAPPQALEKLARSCLESSLQLAVHAIGDGAVGSALDAFEAALRAHGRAPAAPLRLEHAQILGEGDARRMARLGVVASMQPVHATSDMPWVEGVIGPERVRRAYAWRTVVDAGVSLALGSDFPIESPSPARGVWAAVTRRAWDGAPGGGWHPEQRLTLAEAVAGFTTGAAWAAGEAPGTAAIRVGSVADLSVWRAEGAPTAPRLEPQMTIVGGERV